MSNNLIYLNIFGFLLFSFFALPTIYQLQIKEYYYPRILSGFKEREGFFIPLRFPAVKPRNFMIFIFVLVLTGLYYLLLNDLFEEFGFLYIFLWVMGTFVAKLAAFLGMLVTEPLAAFRRGSYMRKAVKMRELSNSKFIGITGSYGKSSVKDLLLTLLEEKYRVSGTIKNQNSEVGVSLSIIKNLKPQTQYFVSEMGAYSLGAIERSCEIVKPHYGFITGIGNQHLSLFGSIENLVDAKSELIEALPEDGRLYINKDFAQSKEMSQRANCSVITYSAKDKSADMYIEIKENGKFSVLYNDLNTVLESEIDVNHQILNLAGVIAFALDEGLTLDQIKTALKRVKVPENKLEKHRSRTGAIVIEDTYNTNLDGFRSGLKYLSQQDHINKYVATRGIIELGEDKDGSYQELSKICLEEGIKIFTTERHLAEIAAKNCDITQIEEKELPALVSKLDKNSVILLEGRFSPKTLDQIRKDYE